MNVQIPTPPPEKVKPEIRLPNFTLHIHQPAITLTIPINNTIKCSDLGRNGNGTCQNAIIPRLPVPTQPCALTPPGGVGTLPNGTIFPQVPCNSQVPSQLPCCSVKEINYFLG